MKLDDLGLTPTQLAEVEQLEPDQINKHLAAIPLTAKSPAGWFLTSIRTGRDPGEPRQIDRDKAIHLAEVWISNAGLYEPDETSLLAGLFDHGGRLHPWEADQALRDRLVALWRHHSVRGHTADEEMRARAGRNAAGYFAQREALTP